MNGEEDLAEICSQMKNFEMTLHVLMIGKKKEILSSPVLLQNSLIFRGVTDNLCGEFQ